MVCGNNLEPVVSVLPKLPVPGFVRNRALQQAHSNHGWYSRASLDVRSDSTASIMPLGWPHLASD